MKPGQHILKPATNFFFFFFSSNLIETTPIIPINFTASELNTTTSVSSNRESVAKLFSESMSSSMSLWGSWDLGNHKSNKVAPERAD
jgi:hypothetical protein